MNANIFFNIEGLQHEDLLKLFSENLWSPEFIETKEAFEKHPVYKELYLKLDDITQRNIGDPPYIAIAKPNHAIFGLVSHLGNVCSIRLNGTKTEDLVNLCHQLIFDLLDYFGNDYKLHFDNIVLKENRSTEVASEGVVLRNNREIQSEAAKLNNDDLTIIRYSLGAAIAIIVASMFVNFYYDPAHTHPKIQFVVTTVNRLIGPLLVTGLVTWLHYRRNRERIIDKSFLIQWT